MIIEHSTTDWPYLLPTLRGPEGRALFHRFHGAVKTRIIQRQRALWSRFIGAGFAVADITAVWPENNLEFFGIRYGGDMHSSRLGDLNLRELEAVDQWLDTHLPQLDAPKPKVNEPDYLRPCPK